MIWGSVFFDICKLYKRGAAENLQISLWTFKQFLYHFQKALDKQIQVRCMTCQQKLIKGFHRNEHKSKSSTLYISV